MKAIDVVGVVDETIDQPWTDLHLGRLQFGLRLEAKHCADNNKIGRAKEFDNFGIGTLLAENAFAEEDRLLVVEIILQIIAEIDRIVRW